MCGIYGISLKKDSISPEQRGSLLTVLSHGNERRGNDSWGFWSGNQGQVTRGLGGVGKYASKMFGMNHGFAHTRKGTCGDVTIPNAHPFEIGKIIGAHNGMISNHDELNRTYKRNHEVDSMHIFSHLAEDRDLTDIRGYGSIEWTEKADAKKIFLCRLSNGELSIRTIVKPGTEKTEVGVVWSSDDSHLKMALESAGLESIDYKVEHGVVYLVESGNLYKTDRKLSLAERYSNEMRDWRDGYSTHGSHFGNATSGTNRGFQTQSSTTVSKGSQKGSSENTGGFGEGNQRLLKEWREANEKLMASRSAIIPVIQTVKESSNGESVIMVPKSLIGKVDASIALNGDLQEVEEKWIGMTNEGWFVFDDKGMPVSKIVD